MPSNNDNLKEYTLVGFNKNVQIIGLDAFAKGLEKHFFSKVTVRNLSLVSDQINLVIELTCNFDFVEGLAYLKKGIWGSFSSKKNSFACQLQQLKDGNDIKIEIDEFSILLKDTSLIINSIYSQSIPEQLEQILNKMESSCDHITRGQSEIPFEIYVPVFEENNLNNACLNTIEPESKQDFFSFWGVYFYSDDDATVYDLKNKTHINGTLRMLNR